MSSLSPWRKISTPQVYSLQLLPKSSAVGGRWSQHFINPRDGPPDRLAGRDANFLESSWKSTREAPFMQKIVLVCRLSGPSSVGYDQSPRGSPPWEINSTQCLSSTDSKGLTSVIHLTGGELPSPDWCPGDALSHPRRWSSCSSSSCFEARMHQLTGTYQGTLEYLE